MLMKKKILSAALSLSMLTGTGIMLPANAEQTFVSTPNAALQLMDGAGMDSEADLQKWSFNGTGEFLESYEGAQGVAKLVPSNGDFIGISQKATMKYGSWYKIRARVRMDGLFGECSDAGFMVLGDTASGNFYIANKGGNSGDMNVNSSEWTEIYTYYRCDSAPDDRNISNGETLPGWTTPFGTEFEGNVTLRFGQNNADAVTDGVYVDYFTVEEIAGENTENLITGGEFNDPDVLKPTTGTSVPPTWFYKSNGFEVEPFTGVMNNIANNGWEYTYHEGDKTDTVNPTSYITVKTPDTTYPFISQFVKLKKGQKYLLSARIRPHSVEGETSSSVTAGLYLLGAEGAKYKETKADCWTKYAEYDKWTEVYQTYTYEGDGDASNVSFTLRVGMYNQNNGKFTAVSNGVDIDDFKVIPIDDSAIVSGGEFNSAYEIDGWSTWGMTTAPQIVNVDGAQALKWIPNSGNYINILSNNKMNLTADKWYKVSARVKLIPNEDGTAAKTEDASIMMNAGDSGDWYKINGAYSNAKMEITSDKWAEIYAYYRYTGAKWESTGSEKSTGLMVRVGEKSGADTVKNGIYVDYIRVEPVKSDNMLVLSTFDDESTVNGTSGTTVYPSWERKTTGYETEVWNGLKSQYLAGNAEWRTENGNGYVHLKNSSHINISQLVSFKPGKTYIARAKVRPIAVEGQEAPYGDFMMMAIDTSGVAEENKPKTYVDVNWKPTTDLKYGEWCKVSREFTIPADTEANSLGNVATTLQLRVGQNTPEKIANGVDVDDITFEEVKFEISKPVLNITDLRDTSDVKASFTATNTGKDKTVKVYAASYDADGRLIKLDSENVVITYGHDIAYTTKAFEIGTNAVKVKVMVWNDSDMTPYTAYSEVEDTANAEYLANTASKLANGENVKAVFYGGSITEARNGWAYMFADKLNEKSSLITSDNYSLGGTGFNLAVSRYDAEVKQSNPDLIFIEYAANDQAAAYDAVCDAAEGLVRKIKESSPDADIVFVKTFSKWMSNSGVMNYPKSFAAVDAVARHYDAMVIDVATPMYNAIIASGKGEEKLDNDVQEYISDNVHPTAKGHELYTNVIWNKIEPLLNMPVDRVVKEYDKIDDSYIIGSLTYMTDDSVMKNGWTITDIPSGNRFSNVSQMIYSENKDDSITYTFNGTGIGLYYDRVLNQNTGALAYSIDGGTEKIVSLKPGTYGHHVTITTGLEKGEHTITLRHIANDSAEADTSGGSLAGSEQGAEITEGSETTPIYLGAFFVLDRK